MKGRVVARVWKLGFASRRVDAPEGSAMVGGAGLNILLSSVERSERDRSSFPQRGALVMTQRPCPWIKKRRNGQVLQGRGAMVSPALIQITVMSFIREYVSKRLRPQVVAMRYASGLLLLWRRWRYTSQQPGIRLGFRFMGSSKSRSNLCIGMRNDRWMTL